ncbi:MAG TPA: adenylate/guanylate cyclase domain-containing protein [Gaiellaceae bacterium]
MNAVVAGAVAVPLLVLVLLVTRPGTDETWENHPAHFWLVLAAAALSVALGYAVSAAARRRRDARLFLASLAFIAAAAFLGLHALTTPGVLLEKNAGFELATPIGLAVAAVFAAASAWEYTTEASAAVMRHANALLAALTLLAAGWGAVSLAEVAPLDHPVVGEQLDGWQVGLAVTGLVLYGLAALGYARLYRRRRSGVLLAVATSFTLLAEAMLVIVWARNWKLSWWEWHLLMLAAFAAIALAARHEWHEERFSALYLDQTLAGARDVSILFADLQGYTSFAEKTPPAQVARVLAEYWDRLIPLLEDAGGEVHQVIGDAVMVIFNKQNDLPEHPVAAARAALLFQAAAREVADAHPDRPRFRVGLNSGEVVAGVIGARGHRKHGVVGDTVNLAARLESRAPVGEVVVGAETARRLPPGTMLERLADLDLKGKSEPVEAYVLRALP